MVAGWLAKSGKVPTVSATIAAIGAMELVHRSKTLVSVGAAAAAEGTEVDNLNFMHHALPVAVQLLQYILPAWCLTYRCSAVLVC